MLVLFSVSHAQDFHGLCVGVGTFAPTAQTPTNGYKDAYEFKEALKYESYWLSSHITTLTNSDATKANIIDALEDLPKNSSNNDVVFFSSHGSTAGICTYESDDVSPSDISDAFGSTFNSYACFIDACHSGVFPDNIDKGVISSACADDELSEGAGPENHSLFSYYLISGLENGCKTAEDLHNYAATPTYNYNNDQTPQLSDNFSGEFIIEYTRINALENDEDWYNSVTLHGFVTVPTGVTLTIKSGASVDLDGIYSITSTEGTIVVENSDDIDPYICIKENGSIKGLYSSFAFAIGVLDDDQTLELAENATLYYDYTLPTGATMDIKSNVSVNLNTHNLRSGSGYILIDSTVSVSPSIIAYNSTDVEGLYSTILPAMTNATTVFVEDGTHTVSDNLNISTGKTLHLNNISDIKFPSSKYLYVNGTLNVDEASFTSVSGTWGGIKFQSGSSGCLKNIDISNAVYGLYFNNASTDSTNPTIHVGPSSIENCSNYGIYVYNSSPEIDSCWVIDEPVYINNGNPHIEQNYFDDQVSYGYSIVLYSSSPTFYRNNITSTQAQLTIEATNGSDPYFGNTPPGLNYLSADEYADGVIWALSSSHPVVGEVEENSPPIAPRYGTQNSIIGGLGVSPAYADGTSSIVAEYCWWGQSPPPDCYGNVDLSQYMTSGSVNIGSGYWDIFPKSNTLFILEKDTCNVKAESMIAIAKKKIRDGDYASAREHLTGVITRYQSSSYAHKALSLGVHLSCKHKEQDVITFIDGLLGNVQDKILKAAIKSRKVSQLRHQQRIDEAIAVSEEMLKENANTEYEIFALFDLFNYYHKDLENEKIALEYLNDLKSKYPNNNLTHIAQSDLGEDIGNVKLAKQNLTFNDPVVEDIIPEAFALHSAYPNPFNPSTTFEYELPVPSQVTCSIYDVLGNRVKEFRFDQNTGTHNITWDGSGEASGVYMIRFTAEAQDGSRSFVDFQKVTLLK